MQLVPFFDCAYQGFVDGVEEDAAPIRLFFDEGFEFLVAQSFSKNMGLYGERIGALHVVAHNERLLPAIHSQILDIVR